MKEWNVLQQLSELFQIPLFTVNQTPITLSSFFIFFCLLGIILLVNRALRRIMALRVLPPFSLPAGTQYTIIRITQYVTWFVGGLLAFQFIGIDLSGVGRHLRISLGWNRIWPAEPYFQLYFRNHLAI